MSSNPFNEDWKQCLNLHYQAVAKARTDLTSLEEILKQVGIKQNDLDTSFVNATISSDELPIEVDRKIAENILKQHDAQCSCNKCKPTNKIKINIPGT